MAGNDKTTGNKGEWSELYTLLRLAAEGRLYAADGDINKIESIYYDISKLIRHQTDGDWEYRREGKINVVSAATGEIVISVPYEQFAQYADTLLEDIQKASGAFDAPEVWYFAKKIKCNTLKAGSGDKTDITLMIHDYKTGSDPVLGFSIKSQLGSPATLLNASTATNFKYELCGHTLSAEEIAKVNSMRRFKDKFDLLNALGTSIRYVSMDSCVCESNFKIIDTSLPLIVAELLKGYYSSNYSKTVDLLEYCVASDICHVGKLLAPMFYEYKIKELLNNVALGMMPASSWQGNYNANGGYIIVKDDGEILCYHIYNRDEFREYLLKNTKLDTPSQSRHNFGQIYVENEKQYIKLNLQIRFIK